jgi:hypothetical protein
MLKFAIDLFYTVPWQDVYTQLSHSIHTRLKKKGKNEKIEIMPTSRSPEVMLNKSARAAIRADCC